MLTNKKYSILIFIFIILFARILFSVTNYISLYEKGNLDKIAIILSIIYIFFSTIKNFKIRKIVLAIIIGIIVFAYISVISEYKQKAIIVIGEVILHYKIFIYLTVFRILFKSKSDYKIITQFINFLFYFTIVGLVINIIIGNNFSEIFNLRSSSRFGVFRYTGFQGDPNVLGYDVSLFLLYYVLKDQKINKIFIPLVIFLIAFILTNSRSMIFILIPVIMILYIRNRKILIKISVVFIILSLVLFVSNSELLFHMFEDILKEKNNFEMGLVTNYVRGVSLIYGVKIALDYFPFGVGAGNFSSPSAIGSQVYKDLGIGWYSEHFQLDCYVGTILGQFGFLGLFILGIAFFVYIETSCYEKYAKKILKYFVLFLFVTSFFQPILYHSRSTIMTALFMHWVIMNNNKDKKNEVGVEVENINNF